MAAIGVAMLPFAWNNLLRDYQKARLESFLNPQVDLQGAGYQLYQAQIAVGSGWLDRQGADERHPGQGDYLPVQTTDFVFAVLAEELGFIGGDRPLRPVRGAALAPARRAWRSSDPFGTMFAAGMASMILFQVVVNVGMVLGVMPITGIPLPFVTHGGASLVSMAIGLGIIQSINIRQSRPDW